MTKANLGIDIRVKENEFGSPTYAQNIARITMYLIQNIKMKVLKYLIFQILGFVHVMNLQKFLNLQITIKRFINFMMITQILKDLFFPHYQQKN